MKIIILDYENHKLDYENHNFVIDISACQNDKKNIILILTLFLKGI